MPHPTSSCSEDSDYDLLRREGIDAATPLLSSGFDFFSSRAPIRLNGNSAPDGKLFFVAPSTRAYMALTSLNQDLLRVDSSISREIKVRTYDLRSSAPPCAEYSSRGTPIGVAILQDQEGVVNYFALSDGASVTAVSLSNHQFSKSRVECPKVLTTLLASGACAAFDMSRVALHIWATVDAHVRGHDLSRIGSPDQLTPQLPSKVVSTRIHHLRDTYSVDSLWNNVCGPSDYLASQSRFESMCLRAWLSARAALNCIDLIRSAKLLDTRTTKSDLLRLLQKHIKEVDVINGAKPLESQSEYTNLSISDGNVNLSNARYKTRIRASNLTRIIATDDSGNEHFGRASHVDGRRTQIKLQIGLSRAITTIRVIGREELSNTDRERDNLLMQMLRGDKNPWMSLFVRLLWLPKADDRALLGLKPDVQQDIPSIFPTSVRLNTSQRQVVVAMMSERPVVIAHGPPGTGKTTTMAAATELWQNSKMPVYIVAHSNVAVKNIAEKLFKCNVDFKLLVSKEFYVEWHEHMYIFMQNRVIRTDEMPIPADKTATERLLKGSTVILSTSGTLCNPTLHNNQLFKIVPMERLIVDEASQINVFDYLPVLDKFRSLEKVCFFGDPKQLPPFGQDRAPTLKSVFEIDHLKDHPGCTYFLDTQYRMPVFIGSFLSRSVYGGQLKSHHSIAGHDCLAFVNEASGIEIKTGFSWTNREEVDTIIALVKYYYRDKPFAVITPYDAQRAAIERALKRENLPWEGHVFNVDSFQGNEQDFILISLVRTRAPGFLTSEQRMNVMLSRSKQGMVVVSSKLFLSGPGSTTLIGKLANHWGKHHASAKHWISRAEILSRNASLPGFDIQLSATTHGNLHYTPKPRTIRSENIYSSVKEPAKRDLTSFPHLPRHLMRETAPRKTKWTYADAAHFGAPVTEIPDIQLPHRPKEIDAYTHEPRPIKESWADIPVAQVRLAQTPGLGMPAHAQRFAPMPVAPHNVQGAYDPIWPLPEDVILTNLGGWLKPEPSTRKSNTLSMTLKPVVLKGAKIKLTFGDQRRAR